MAGAEGNLGDRPLVSVVVPAWNAERWLDECLASVRAQQGAFEQEIIVVDDGSTDGTASLARRHAGVRCVTQPQRGPAAARNAGIADAAGEFVAFLDADDLWPPGKLALQLSVLRRHPDAALVFGDCRQFDAGGPRQQTLFDSDGLGAGAWGSDEILNDAYRRLLTGNFMTTGSVVARRSVLRAMNGFAEELRLVEDLDLWLRIARRYPVAWCEPVCLLRRRHDANTSRDAEAMALAYLEVLGRQTPAAPGAGGVTAAALAALAALEHAHLAERALAQRRAGVARRHARSAFAARRSARALWLLLRALALRDTGSVREPGR